jgi:hypothetical protein
VSQEGAEHLIALFEVLNRLEEGYDLKRGHNLPIEELNQFPLARKETYREEVLRGAGHTNDEGPDAVRAVAPNVVRKYREEPSNLIALRPYRLRVRNEGTWPRELRRDKRGSLLRGELTPRTLEELGARDELLKRPLKYGAVLTDVEASEVKAKGMRDLYGREEILLGKPAGADSPQRPRQEREVSNQLLRLRVAVSFGT